MSNFKDWYFSHKPVFGATLGAIIFFATLASIAYVAGLPFWPALWGLIRFSAFIVGVVTGVTYTVYCFSTDKYTTFKDWLNGR